MTNYSKEIHAAHEEISLRVEEARYLEELGLSEDAIGLYRALQYHHKLSALAASRCLNRLPQAMYRLFYELEGLGLSVRRGSRPMIFCGVAPAVGLATAYSSKVGILSRLLSQTGHPLDAHVHTEMIIGKSALYERYSQLATNARESIEIFSIGIAYSPGLVAIQKQAVGRGVKVRHIVQERRPSNYHILKTWRDIGVDIRVLPRKRGFHLMVFDDTAAIIAFSSPDDTDERVSVLSRHQEVVVALRSMFSQLWSESRPITWLSEKS